MYIVFATATGAIQSAIDGSDAVEGQLLSDLVALSEAGGMALAAMDPGLSLVDISNAYVSDFTLDQSIDTVALSVTLTARQPLEPGWPVAPNAPFTLDMESGNLPAATTIVARNSADETASSDKPLDPIVLTEPGAYEIMILPPNPHFPIKVRMEIF